MNLVVFKEILF